MSPHACIRNSRHLCLQVSTVPNKRTWTTFCSGRSSAHTSDFWFPGMRSQTYEKSDTSSFSRHQQTLPREQAREGISVPWRMFCCHQLPPLFFSSASSNSRTICRSPSTRLICRDADPLLEPHMSDCCAKVATWSATLVHEKQRHTMRSDS